jgi:exodeoxyribonuclease-3
VAASLKDGGLESAWHASSGESFGTESAATYFHYWKRELGAHLDYVFLDGPRRKALKGVSIGEFGNWVGNKTSDHVPVIAEIEDAAFSI